MHDFRFELDKVTALLGSVWQLTMRNLDIIDTRDKLVIYPKVALLSAATDSELLKLRRIRASKN